MSALGQHKPGTLINLQRRPIGYRAPQPEESPPAPPPTPAPPPPSKAPSATGVVIRSEGQRQLCALPATLREIASRLGDAVSVQAVSCWRRGDKAPAAAYREALAREYGIPPEAWGHMPQPPEDTPAPPKPTQRAKLTATAPNSLEDCHQLLDLIRGDRDRGDLLVTERLKLVDAEAKLLALLSRLEAQHELREDRYVRQHPAWQRARRTIVEALAPHPAAAKAVIDALRKIDM